MANQLVIIAFSYCLLAFCPSFAQDTTQQQADAQISVRQAISACRFGLELVCMNATGQLSARQEKGCDQCSRFLSCNYQAGRIISDKNSYDYLYDRVTMEPIVGGREFFIARCTTSALYGESTHL